MTDRPSDAVLDFAEELRTRKRARIADVEWALYAEKLYDPPAPKTLREMASRHGVDGAISRLESLWARSEREMRAERDERTQRLERERRQREQAAAEKADGREGQSLVSRILRVLTEARIVSEISAAAVGRSSASAEHPSRILSEKDSPLADRISSRLLEAVRWCEREVDRHRSSPLPGQTVRNVDERLDMVKGLNARQASVRDASLGTAEQIRALRKSRGVDEETGEKTA